MLAIFPLLVFLGTAYAGYVLVGQIREEKGALPPALNMHRFSALVGVVFLGMVIGFTETSKLTIVALVILIGAMAGGLSLFRLLYKDSSPPLIMIYGHAGFAIMGMVMLLVSVLL